MSQSRFSIVLVGVSALLRRPLVSRLRPAVFAARGSGGFRRSALPSVSAFAARRVGLRAHGFRFSARTASEIAARRVGLRAHGFRFSARTASELPSSGWFCRLPLRRLPLGGLAFGLRFRGCHSAGWPSGSRLPLFGTRRFGVAARRVGLLAHRFRFSACAASGLPLGELVLPPSASEIAARRVGLRAHASELPSAGWPSGSRLPLSARTASGLPLGGLTFGLTASAFRHAPLRGCPRRVGLRASASAFRHAPIRTAALPKRGPTEHNDTTTVSLQNTYPNMLTYHIVRRKHFKTGKLLYYPQLVTPVADDHMHIIERIEKKCTLASADVKAVVDALEVEIIDSLRQGRSVRLGDLGSFRPTLRCSAGVGLPELAGVGQIKRVHVVFHPSSRIRRALSVKDHAVSFVQRDKKKHGANAQQGGSPTGGATPGAPAPSTGSSAAGSAVTPPGTPVPAPPSTGTPAGTPVPAAPSPTTSTTTGTPAPSTGSSAAGSAVTPPGTPVPAPPSTGTPAGTPVPAAPSTGTPAGTPVPAAPSTGTPAGTPVPATPSTGTPAVSGTPAAGGA